MKNKKMIEILGVGIVVLIIGIIGFLLSKSFFLPAIENYCNKDDYSVSINILSTMGDYYDGEIVIANLTDAPMESWALYFKTKDEFLRVEDGVVVSNDYGYCLNGTSLSNTTIIPAGGKISIPFRAEGKSRKLRGAKLCCRESLPEITEGMQYQMHGENCQVDATITNITENEYTVKLVITNTAKEPITDWGLVFNTEDSITEVENAKCITTNSEIKLLTGLEPQEIKKDASIEITYKANITDTPKFPQEMIFCSINTYVITEEQQIQYIECNLRDTGLVGLTLINAGSEDNYNITFEKNYGSEIKEVYHPEITWSGSPYQAVCQVNIEEEIPEETFVMELRMTGIASDQECLYGMQFGELLDETFIYAEDVMCFEQDEDTMPVVSTADGLHSYIDNQIIITLHHEVNAQEINELANTYGVIIVEHEWDTFYTLSFMEDMDYETLNDMASKMEAEEKVEYAYPNYIIPCNAIGGPPAGMMESR